MLNFITIIFVTGLSASFAAESNDIQKCIEICVNSTMCTPSQEQHHQNCSQQSDKERFEKCISTCKTTNISNTENLKKKLLNEHKINNNKNTINLGEINSSNQSSLYVEKMDFYKQLSENIELGNKFGKGGDNFTLLTLNNPQNNNKSKDSHRYIIKEIIGAIKNRIKNGLNKLVNLLENFSKSPTDDNKFKSNSINESSNKKKLNVLLQLLDALKLSNDGPSQNGKVKREISLQNIGDKFGGYVGEEIGRKIATREMGHGMAGKMFGKVGAMAGKTIGERYGRKMGQKVANFPKNTLHNMGVFSNPPAPKPNYGKNLPMQKFCCFKC